MKILFFIILGLFFVVTPVYGQLLSDATGLVNRFDIQAGGHTFEVETVSNYSIKDFNFDEDQKRLTLYISSGLENNLGELIIPQNLLGGNFTFYLNDQAFFPTLNSNEKISFITLNFTGSGDNKLDIFGTSSISDMSNSKNNSNTTSSIVELKSSEDEVGGCLIATAAFGSELAPQVQQLRELRDNTILSTESGTAFMTGFNQFYYLFSPAIADLERENPIFKEIVKISIAPMLSTLSILNYVDIGSEEEMLSFGVGVILMNVGMYLGIPAVVIVKIKKIKK